MVYPGIAAMQKNTSTEIPRQTSRDPMDNVDTSFIQVERKNGRMHSLSFCRFQRVDCTFSVDIFGLRFSDGLGYSISEASFWPSFVLDGQKSPKEASNVG
jgi:hypothetical protein